MNYNLIVVPLGRNTPGILADVRKHFGQCITPARVFVVARETEPDDIVRAALDYVRRFANEWQEYLIFCTTSGVLSTEEGQCPLLDHYYYDECDSGTDCRALIVANGGTTTQTWAIARWVASKEEAHMEVYDIQHDSMVRLDAH